MDYLKIGHRIRQYRKLRGLSQAQLAEKIDISVAHMSHIETANTKLSLPVLVKIAEELSVSTDDLLYDIPKRNINEISSEIFDIVSSCSLRESIFLLSILRSVKQSFDRYCEDMKPETDTSFWKNI